jgi:SAM-dependent methyltransferase
MTTEYDIVQYPHRPFAQTHPDRLAVQGMLFGMQPALPTKCRVLELGCGSGGNLLPLADLFPETFFYGIDLAPTAIEIGHKRIATLGLQNVRLEEMDVMDFPAEAGQFDYILAHGLISWVPQVVREKVFKLCEDHLSPQGIAYISYNAFPGCYVRKMWREMMLFHTRQFTSPADKVQQARSIMQMIAHGSTKEDPVHQLAKEAFENRGAMSDSALFHDYLAGVWNPFHFHEFVGQAGQYGLQYLAEAVYGDMQPPGLTPQANAKLKAFRDRGDVLRYEQYLDWFKLRGFRQTLLCRKSVELRRPADMFAMSKFHYSAPIQIVPVQDPQAPQDAKAFRQTITDVTITTNNPLAVHALQKIGAAWPSTCSFAELAQGFDAMTLCQALHTFYASAFLNVHTVARFGMGIPTEKPVAWRVARLEASIESSVPHLHHGSINLENESVRKLITQLDGTKTRADLAPEHGGADALEETLRTMARSGILVA